MMKNITVEIGKLEDNRWSAILSEFNDANIYQTIPYGDVKWGKDHIGHILIKNNKNIIGAAQFVKKKIPGLMTTIVYIYRGPLWKIKKQNENQDYLYYVIEAIYNEFVIKRNFVVRILPNEYIPNKFDIDMIFLKNGFIVNNQIQNSQSIAVDIFHDKKQQLNTFTKKWRENLRRAKRYNMELLKGNDMHILERFHVLYTDMYKRKKFAEFVDINMYLEIQKKLNKEQKMSTMIACLDGKDIAGLVWTDLGDHGIPIFSATATKGLKLRGSYLLRWNLIEELKKKNIMKLDQGGINKINNPGGYKFKSGMGGQEIKFTGPYDAFPNTLDKILINVIDKIRHYKKKFKLYLHKR